MLRWSQLLVIVRATGTTSAGNSSRQSIATVTKNRCFATLVTASFLITTTTTTRKHTGITSAEAFGLPILTYNNKPVRLMSSTSDTITTGYLNAADAAALDGELMSTPGYTLEQLMELAGLAVAEAVYEVISFALPDGNTKSPRRETKILVICGPGNNGGDGLVAARHLYMFGCTDIMIVYPALHKVKHPHYINLITQCQDLGITISVDMPNDWSSQYSLVVDAIFGFSFRGDPRPPYDTILEQLKGLNGNDKITTVAVDVPSGWNVDGDDSQNRFIPDVLVSLTAPKHCVKNFQGRHFVGGRFLPPSLARKYNISMPPYPGVAQVMEITPSHHNVPTDVDRGWEIEYAKYLAEKEQEQTSEANQSTNKNEATWEEQYAAYCAEKEAQLQLIDEQKRQGNQTK
jgi:NAD(P)H-hydrate epimerase